MKTPLVVRHMRWMLLLFVVVIGIGCSRQPEIEVAEAPPRKVEVTRAVQGDIRNALDFSGTIHAQAQVMLYPDVPGTVLELNVDEGDLVEKNQVLAVLEHERLQLQLDQARAAYQAASTALDQAQKLSEIRVRAQVEQAKAQLAGAESGLKQVMDLSQTRTMLQVEQAEAGLQALRANLEKIIRGARDEDRKQAQAAVEQAQAGLENAKLNHDRIRNLFESGAISKQAFDQSQTQLDIAQAQYDMTAEQQRIVMTGARPEDIDAMRAQVRQAEAMLELATVQANTRTWEQDIALANSQVDAAQAALLAAQALEEAESWEAEIVSAQTVTAQAKAALALAERAVADATIRSPIRGVVSKCYLDPGGKANPSAPLFEIVDITRVKVLVRALESELAVLNVGMSALVKVAVLSEPVSGTISLISPTVDTSRRAAEVEIQLANRQMLLKPGMFASVEIPLDIRESAVLLPRSAIVDGDSNDTGTVFVVEAGAVEKRGVSLGILQDAIAEVVQGIDVGDTVVASAQTILRDGDKVVPVER